MNKEILKMEIKNAVRAAIKNAGFRSVDDVNKYIVQKSKEYGSKNEFLSSAEYRAAYPEISRIFEEDKKRKAENNFASVVQYQGKWVIKRESGGYVASGRGTFGGIAEFDDKSKAEAYAKKLKYILK